MVGLLKELSVLELKSSGEAACMSAWLFGVSGDLEFNREGGFLPAAYTEWLLL